MAVVHPRGVNRTVPQHEALDRKMEDEARPRADGS